MSLKGILREKVGKIDKKKLLEEKKSIDEKNKTKTKSVAKSKTAKEKVEKIDKKNKTKAKKVATEKDTSKEKILNEIYILRLDCEIYESSLRTITIVSDSTIKFSNKIDKNIFNSILITVTNDIKRQLIKETKDRYYLKVNFSLAPTKSVEAYPNLKSKETVVLDSKNIVPETTKLFDNFCHEIFRKEKYLVATPVNTISFIAKHNPLLCKEEKLDK